VTVVIAGGSGFLGGKLAKRLESEGQRVLTLTRRAAGNRGEIAWRPDGEAGELPRHLDGTDAVVNLAGAGIADTRWSAARKQEILASRVLSTRTLVRAMALCSRPPKVFVSGSAVGYYGHRGAEPVSETADPGSDFLARVCVEWEQEARAVESTATRLAIVRTGLPLDKSGGALARMLLPFKLGLGATIASGDQYMSWIHVDDWTAMMSWLIRDDRARGAFNATAPEPVTNRTFTRTLARVLHRPAVLRAPGFVLRAALGEMASVLIEGQSVVPALAEQLGFRFTYRALEPALESLNL
jgi:uncharacterized protein (TIGR01777 family)